MATRYENLAGVNSNYIDGSFASLSQVADGQSIMLFGAAEKGLSNTPFLVSDIGLVASEFGRESDLTLLASQVSDSANAQILVTRVGGKQTHVIIEKPIEGSKEKEILLRISPRERGGKEIFDKVAVALVPYKDGAIIRQRVVLFDTDSEAVIYDSEEILSIDDTLFEVEIGNDVGEILISEATSYTQPTDAAAINTLAEEDVRSVFTISELPTIKSIVTSATITSSFNSFEDIFAATLTNIANIAPSHIDGEDGSTMSMCERFASMEAAYADLEDAALDFAYCDGCFADVAQIPASGLSSAEFQHWDQYYLGSAHRYVDAGKPHVTMFASPEPFSVDRVITAATTITHAALSLTNFSIHEESQDLGLALSLAEIYFHQNATTKVEEFPNKKGRYEIHVSADLTATTTNSISTKMFSFTIPAGAGALDDPALGKVDLKDLFKVNGDAAGTYDISQLVLTHFDLTGELVPEALFDELMVEKSGKLVLSDTAYARRVNFAHQSASMAYHASTEYKSMLSVVPTTRARGGLRQLARWAGNAPTYEIDANGDLVVKTDGTGFMGLDVLFGNKSFRHNDNSKGLAYGGLIKTVKGFGIDSSDEELDARGFPIDLGKHLLVVGAYGVVPIPGSGRTPSFVVSNLGPKIIQRLTDLPVNEEPIGPVNGVLPGVSTTGAINSRALLNDLALGRVIMVGTDGSIATFRTAALPSSDYTRVSTIRAANLVLDAVRSTSLKYLGRAFSDAQLAALDAELAGVMQSFKVDGSIQDGSVQSSASRLDRINGRLNLKVQFIPPLSIEAITVDLTVSAPQA